jgi:aminomethyltransferase
VRGHWRSGNALLFGLHRRAGLRNAPPCGLAASDSLQAEACLPLYGHEIDEQTDPYSAGLAAAALRLVGFEMIEPSVPRQGYAITAAGRPVGRVTTGFFSPSTGSYLGMGYVEEARAGTGQEVAIVIRDTPKAARIVGRPFYKSPNWR